jgi:hypothetical protein
MENVPALGQRRRRNIRPQYRRLEMHIIIGFGVVAAIIAFAFGQRALQVFVAICLGVPALFVLFIIAGEVTRGGPDDVPFGKMGHRVSVEQPVAAYVAPPVAAYVAPPLTQPRQLTQEEIEQSERENEGVNGDWWEYVEAAQAKRFPVSMPTEPMIYNHVHKYCFWYRTTGAKSFRECVDKAFAAMTGNQAAQIAVGN